MVIGLLGIFSTQIIESARFKANRADIRVKQQEDMAKEISQYLFSAELISEVIEKNWTTEPELKPLIAEYNTSVVSLRKNEYVFRAWVKKYWDEQHLEVFEKLVKVVKEFDSAIHELNDEFELVIITKSQPKIDRKKAEDALKILKPALRNMQNHASAFLESI